MLFWQGGSPLSTLSTHLQQERVLSLQKRRRQGCVSPDLLDALPRTRAIHLPSYSCPSVANGRLFISFFVCCVAA